MLSRDSMIRIKEEKGWLLLTHPDHARLAGLLGGLWGNSTFEVPSPRESVLTAVSRHDDAWAERDALPEITPEGLPSAFSEELVGTYDAFEEIDFSSYLAVRGRATELVAGNDPYAANLISRHTVNLLTEQADLSTLSEAGKEEHRRFIEGQLARQTELILSSGRDPDQEEENLVRNFKFLQACDSFSLMACVRFSKPLPLRHAQVRRDGTGVLITCTPLGSDTYRLSPWPLSVDSARFELKAKRVVGHEFPSVEAFRQAVERAEEITFTVQVKPSS